MKTIPLPLHQETLFVADTTLADTLAWIADRCKKPGFARLLTLNPEILMAGHHNTDIASLLATADLTLPDGTGIVACIRLCFGHGIARVTGSDLAPALITSGRYRIYLLGSTPDTLQKAAQNPTICGHHHGFWTETEWPGIAAYIAESKPDIVLVGMGFPRQEQVLEKLKSSMSHGIGIGVGGVIEMLAGVHPRAPQWTQNLHLEWLYRALKQPSRLSRLRWIGGFGAYTWSLWWQRRCV